jgi:hypothetical protein
MRAECQVHLESVDRVWMTFDRSDPPFGPVWPIQLLEINVHYAPPMILKQEQIKTNTSLF